MENRTISLRIDDIPLPPAEASPNARAGWRAKAKAVAQWRGQCKVLIQNVRVRAPRPLTCPVVVSLEFWCGRCMVGGSQVDDGRYRPKDVDNAVAACKALIDAIVDAGVIPDDSHHHLKLGSVVIRRNPNGRERMPQKIVLRISESTVSTESPQIAESTESRETA